MTDKFRLTIMKQKKVLLQISLSVSYIERLFDKNSVLSIREVFGIQNYTIH